MNICLKTLAGVSALMLFSAGNVSAAQQSFTSSSNQVQLIELYTSEGCSSCPPADKHLGKLKSDKGLWSEKVPVAFHVDYWDYIGWQDPYAKAENSKRQRAHAALGNVSNVYTPGFVVDGEEWRGFFRRAKLPAPTEQTPGPLSLSYDDGQVSVSFKPESQLPASLRLQIAWLGAGIEVAVTDGENNGRRLKHDFVVLKRQELMLSANSDFQHQGPFAGNTLPEAEQYALVAWVEDARGRSVQAVGGWAAP